MAPRRRKAGSKGLVANVYAAWDRRRGVTYYRYRRPDTGAWRGLGTDRAAANRAGRKLNQVLVPDEAATDRVVERVLDERVERLGPLAERFKAHLREITDSDGNRRAAKTLSEYDRMVDAFVAHMGADTVVDEIGRRAVTGYLEGRPSRSYNAHRSVLRQLFALYVATSDRADNPVEGTLTKAHVVARARLTYDEYRRIWKAAPPWFRNAMDLSLRSLQARAEVAALRFDDEREPGYLFVDRQKVARHEAGHIRIAIGPRLRQVIDGCRDERLSLPAAIPLGSFAGSSRIPVPAAPPSAPVAVIPVGSFRGLTRTPAVEPVSGVPVVRWSCTPSPPISSPPRSRNGCGARSKSPGVGRPPRSRRSS